MSEAIRRDSETKRARSEDLNDVGSKVRVLKPMLHAVADNAERRFKGPAGGNRELGLDDELPRSSTRKMLPKLDPTKPGLIRWSHIRIAYDGTRTEGLHQVIELFRLPFLARFLDLPKPGTRGDCGYGIPSACRAGRKVALSGYRLSANCRTQLVRMNCDSACFPTCGIDLRNLAGWGRGKDKIERDRRDIVAGAFDAERRTDQACPEQGKFVCRREAHQASFRVALQVATSSLAFWICRALSWRLLSGTVPGILRNTKTASHSPVPVCVCRPMPASRELGDRPRPEACFSRDLGQGRSTLAGTCA